MAQLIWKSFTNSFF